LNCLKCQLARSSADSRLTIQRLVEEVIAQKLGKRTELSWHEARQIVQHVTTLIGSQAKITSEFLEMDLATENPLLPV